MRVKTILALGWLGAVGTALAQTNTSTNGPAMVVTLGGGPRVQCGATAGFANGNTLQDSQFNAPWSVAADSQGNVYIADKNNNAVRLITQAGNTATSFTSTYAGQKFPGVIGVATDPSNGVYILETSGVVYKYQYQTLLSTTTLPNFGGSATCLTAVQDGSSRVFVGANENGNGEIWLCDTARGNSTLLYSSANLSPSGLTITTGSKLAISDLNNNAIELFDPSTGVLSPWVGGNGQGYADGDPGHSQFNQPRGLTTSSDGHVIVADTGNNFVRQIDLQGVTTTIYGTTSNYWPAKNYCNAVPAVYRGWLDGPAGDDSFNGSSAEAFAPAGVAIGPASLAAGATNSSTNGTLFVTELHYSLFREVTGLPLATLSSNTVSTNSSGAPPSQNSIGFARDYYAGVGSTPVIPVTLYLTTGVILKSIQFDVEVTPDPDNSDKNLQPINALSTSTNDFVPVGGLAPAGTVVTFQEYPYSTPGYGQGVGITMLTATNGMSAAGTATVALLEVQLPPSVREGESYTLNVLYPSGTSNGIAGIVPLSSLPARHLYIQHIPFLSGDTAPAMGYNAGEFGDTNLDNADVNNALYASAGIRVPFPFTDAFAAMDAFPQLPGLVGDGVINFNDWETILYRSLGFLTNNWEIYWAADGSGLVNAPIGWTPASGPGKVKLDTPAAPPGSVWQCQAAVGAQNIETSFGSCRIPVYVNVHPGCSLSGMQFRAIVSPNAGSPPPGAVQFSPALAPSDLITLPGLSPNDIVCAWTLNAFTPPLQNSNFLGYLTFPITNAAAGNSYTVHFVGVGGAPNLATEYQMESFPGTASVLTSPAPPVSRTSDEWKLHFFGSLTNEMAADNVDADGDGMSNLQEYLAGTDPTDPLSTLRFSSSAVSTGASPAVSFSWLTAPGKSYVLEGRLAANRGLWTPISTNIGDGYFFQAVVTNHSGASQFYRIRLQP